MLQKPNPWRKEEIGQILEAGLMEVPEVKDRALVKGEKAGAENSDVVKEMVAMADLEGGGRKMSFCTRCGKERVVISTRQEKIGNSLVTYTVTECPDLDCQKAVNKNLKNDEIRRAAMKEEQEKRLLQRISRKAE